MIYLNETEDGIWVTTEEDSNGIEVTYSDIGKYDTIATMVKPNLAYLVALAKYLDLEDYINFTPIEKEQTKEEYKRFMENEVFGEPIEAGTIFLNDTVDITDPCYDRNVGYCSYDCVPGEYECSYVLSDEGDWGERVESCQIVHKNHNIELDDFWEVIDNIPVDAGVAGFFKNKPDFDNKEWGNICSIMRKGAAWNINNATTEKGQVWSGFWTSSGYGDGCYDVEAVLHEDKIIAARIIFIEDYDDEDEEY